MAQIKSMRWSELVLKVSNGESPETFTPKCSINSSTGITFTAGVSEDTIPDCDDLQKIQWLVREKVSLGIEVNGAGKLHRPDVKFFLDWWKGVDPVNCIVVLMDSDPANVIEIEVPLHLITFTMNGDSGTPMVTSDMSLQSTGAMTETYGANVGGA